MQAAGLRDGGDLRTGHGGAVPGRGVGDKIPAKYEPGEFVVSNAMLDTAPGLRDQLHELRNGVLAAQGKTPAEADAKALRGGSLRAMDGVDVLERPMSADEAARFRPTEAAAHSQRMNPTLSPNNPQFHGDGRYGAPGYDAGSTRSPNEVQAGQRALVESRPGAGNSVGGSQDAAGRVADKGLWGRTKDGVGSAARGVKSVATGSFLDADVGKVARSVGGGLRSAATGNLGGFAAAGAGMAGAAQGFNTPTEQYRKRLGMDDAGGLGGDLLARSVGVLADVGDNLTGGYASKLGRYLAGDDSDPSAAAAPQPTTPSLRNPIAAPQPAHVEQPPTVTPGIRRVNGGSSALFSNQPDADNAKLMGRGQVSTQNMDAADALAGRSQAEARASLREPEAPPANGGLFIGADTGGFGLLDKGYQRERSLRMEGASDDLTAFRKEGNEAPRRAAERNAETQRSLRTDATTRRGQDLELDGRSLTAQSAAATARANAIREQFNKDRDFGASQRRDDQTMGDTARKGLAEEMKVFGADGKLDEGASAASVAVAQQLFPGIDRLTPEARSKVMPDVKEMAAIFNKAKDQDKVGFDALKFWEPARPSLRSMPNAKGGTTEQVSGLGGWFTAGAENGDTLLNNNGKTLNLGPLNERQRELLKRAQTNGWGQ